MLQSLQSIKRVIPYGLGRGFIAETLVHTSKGPYSTGGRLSEKDVEEIQIPVPWGHIAGKYWGPRDRKTFLLLHGWQDNAGSFDLLIPHLPPEYSYLAIDLPGHGRSSHFPKGVFYTMFDVLASIRRIQKHFQWRQFSLMGHSLGSMQVCAFAGTFPNDVADVIAFETLTPASNKPDVSHAKARERLENMLRYESYKSNDTKGYTEEELIAKMKEALKIDDVNLCRIMMKRGVTWTNGSYSVNRDPRIKGLPPFGFTFSDNKQLAERIKCNFLVVKSQDTEYYGESKEDFYTILDIIKKSARRCECKHIRGIHHFHMEKPEAVAAIVAEFMASAK